METLLLTSAGMRMKDEILKLVPKDPPDIRLAHITTAALSFKRAPWMISDKREMSAAGFYVQDVDLRGKREDDLRNELEGKDIIYGQGGNPYYLLKYVYQSGFDRVIKELISKGVLYVGASAGSYIMCPTLEMAMWARPERLRYGLAPDVKALGYVPFLLKVHYDAKNRERNEQVKEEMSKTKYPVRILTDDQAILVQDGKTTLVGKGEEIKLL